MKLKEDIKPISQLKAQAASILEELSLTQRPVIITQNGEARAILQDVQSYDRMKTALALFKLMTQGEKELEAGETIDHDELFASIEKRLEKIK